MWEQAAQPQDAALHAASCPVARLAPAPSPTCIYPVSCCWLVGAPTRSRTADLPLALPTGEHCSGAFAAPATVPASAAPALAAAAQAAAGGITLFRHNAAHSSLAGMVLTAALDPTSLAGMPCTALKTFSAWLNWDFGVLTMKARTSPL
jgi:hypothetical protein